MNNNIEKKNRKGSRISYFRLRYRWNIPIQWIQIPSVHSKWIKNRYYVEFMHEHTHTFVCFYLKLGSVSIVYQDTGRNFVCQSHSNIFSKHLFSVQDFMPANMFPIFFVHFTKQIEPMLLFSVSFTLWYVNFRKGILFDSKHAKCHNISKAETFAIGSTNAKKALAMFEKWLCGCLPQNVNTHLHKLLANFIVISRVIFSVVTRNNVLFAILNDSCTGGFRKLVSLRSTKPFSYYYVIIWCCSF